MNLVPTASTTAMLALGDALAMTVLVEKGFSPDDFADLHPARHARTGGRGASIGSMHSGDDLPVVAAGTPMRAVIARDHPRALGITCVVDGDGRLSASSPTATCAARWPPSADVLRAHGRRRS